MEDELGVLVDRITLFLAYVSLFLAVYIVGIEFVLPSYVGMRLKRDNDKKGPPKARTARMIASYERFKKIIEVLDTLGDEDDGARAEGADGDAAKTGDTLKTGDRVRRAIGASRRRRAKASAENREGERARNDESDSGDDGGRGEGEGGSGARKRKRKAKRGTGIEDPFVVDWRSLLVDPLDDPNGDDDGLDDERIDAASIALFVERARSLLSPSDCDAMSAAFDSYSRRTMGYDALVRMAVGTLVAAKCWDLLGWFQVLAPSPRHLIRFQRVVEHTRESNPSECEDLPLFTDVLPLVFVLGSPRHSLGLRHSAAVAILDQLVTCARVLPSVKPRSGDSDESGEGEGATVDADGTSTLSKATYDMRVPNVFLASGGLEVLVELAKADASFREVARAVLRRLMAMTIANGANGDPQAFLAQASKGAAMRPK